MSSENKHIPHHKSIDDIGTDVKFEKYEKKRHQWARWEWWGVVLGLPAAILGIPAAGFALYDFIYRHPREVRATEQTAADLRLQVEHTPAHITSDIKTMIDPLNQREAAHLALSYAARPTDSIGENTALLTPDQRILAQATADTGTPYLLEIDGNGAATLDTDDSFRQKFGSKFKPNGQSWTIIALAADPASLSPNRITQIQSDLVKNLTPLNLPPGRQITWRDSGWTWGKPADTSSRAPDTDSSLEVELSAHANAMESLLKSEFPNTPFIGRSFSVNSAAPATPPVGP